MGNLNKEVKGLFKRYMARKEEELHKPYSYRSEGYYSSLFPEKAKKDFHGVIFFYEWSDIGRTPIRYFSIPLFEKFLNESELTLEPYQREIISNLEESYVSCKNGTKELIVRGSYDGLKDALYRNNGAGPQFILPINRMLEATPCGHGRPPMYATKCGPEQWIG